MHVTLTRVNTGDHPIESAGIFAEEMLTWLRDVEGFEGLLMLSRDGESVGLTFWATREEAERQGAVRQQFIQRLTAAVDVEIVERTGYELTFGHLGSLSAD